MTPKDFSSPQFNTAASSTSDLRIASTALHRDSESQTGSREWWAQRWIDVLESFGWKRRLERARNYVREGRIMSLEFQGPKVIAQVQGTAPYPYQVSLSLDPFSDEQWGYVTEEMSHRAIFAAKLLAGEMPQNIEEAFTASGLSLFPFSKFDIHSQCSCPDPANPCKHVGAVYYLLGDYFNQDPFILFQLRNRTKKRIIESLRKMWSTGSGIQHHIADSNQLSSQITSLEVGQKFWQYNIQLDASLVVITPSPSNETVLDVLGPISLEADLPAGKQSDSVSNRVTTEYLEKVYAVASQQSFISAMVTQEAE